ncbi:MAG: low molecular weight phosphotyrosine protein phosphatase [Pseudomonadota bacterium]
MSPADDSTSDRLPLPARLVVVCVGNICRSPMVEALLSLALRERGCGVRVTSAGTNACVGLPADPWALQLMAERGLDIGAHRGRQLLPRQLGADTQVMVTAEDQRAWLLRKRSSMKGRILHLGAYTGEDVIDPVGGNRARFEQALEAIDAGIERWLAQGWRLAD